MTKSNRLRIAPSFPEGRILSIAAILAAAAATPAWAVYIGGAVTPGAVMDNTAIKIELKSYSSSGTLPVGYVYGVAYVAPDANWATTGALDVSFQLFNPGNPPLTSGAPKLKAADGIQFVISPTTTGTVYTSTTTSALTTFSISYLGSTLVSKTTTVPISTTGSGNYISGGTYGGTGGGPSSGFTYQAIATADLTAPAAPSVANAPGDIVNWVITPNAGKMYVSDFYKTATASGGIEMGIHYIGVNGTSSYFGSTPADVTYAVPEPSTWAALAGLGAFVGWEFRSRRNRGNRSTGSQG